MIVLSAEIGEAPIDPEGGMVRYLLEWSSDGDDTPVQQGPIEDTLFMLRESDGVTFDPGERWTVTVTPIDEQGASGPEITGVYLIGAGGAVTFEGWTIR